MPSKISQFWQDLKRRNVVRVVTVYAASAFVILELVDIIGEPFGLPDWTLNLVLILLIVGFFIAVIVSWIYDIHPEEGIVKTESVQEGKSGGSPVASNGWKIASYISFVVIVGLIVLNIIPRTGEKKILDKSIAVLPFRNDSPDQERMYFINGTMEAILDNLCKIEDLRVPGRTSVEQYRDNPKPIPVVAEEMNVSYILQGSGHRDGNNVRLFVQLLDGRRDQHIWSKSYDADIEEIFSMQSEIAQMIASEIQVVITPEEKELIEKIPTSNLTALDFYQRGEQERWNGEIESAEYFFNEALKYDPSFAQAYIGLGRTYMFKHYNETYFNEDFLDSMLFLANLALSFDEQLYAGYLLRGIYYRERGDTEQALQELDHAIELNPNSWDAYYQKIWIYQNDDLKNALYNAFKCMALYQGPLLQNIYWAISAQYLIAGITDKSVYYLEEFLKLSGDSSLYYLGLSDVEALLNEDIAQSLKCLKKAYQFDSLNIQTIRDIAEMYMLTKEYEASLRFYKRYVELVESSGNLGINNMHRVGYSYWMNGYTEEAMNYFHKQIEYLNNAINLGRDYVSHFLYYDLAAVYAFLGEKDKAYENLRIFDQQKRFPKWIYVHIKRDPLFNHIRNEPEFQQIVRDVEAKYQAEHERVRQWLEENDR
jgi:TolB-like protein